MISAVLIDDENNALEVLEWQLQTFCPEVAIVTSCNSAIAGIDAITKHQPNLVFLDVEMPGHNGFDVVRAFPNPTFQVIFTTAYDQFAIKAIKFAAFDFLLKPIDSGELKEAVERFTKQIQTPSMQNYERLEQAYYHDLQKISLPTSEGLTFIAPNDIIRCESSSNYTRIFFTDKKQMLISKTLKEVEQLLKAASFFRIHHSHLINLKHVSKYIKTDGGMVEMIDGSHVIISRQKKDDFLLLMLKGE